MIRSIRVRGGFLCAAVLVFLGACDNPFTGWTKMLEPAPKGDITVEIFSRRTLVAIGGKDTIIVVTTLEAGREVSPADTTVITHDPRIVAVRRLAWIARDTLAELGYKPRAATPVTTELYEIEGIVLGNTTIVASSSSDPAAKATQTIRVTNPQ